MNIHWISFAAAGTSGSGAKLALTPGTNVYFRVKKTGQTLAGSTQTLVVAGRMVAPAGVAIANGTTAGTFKLTGVDNTMEYKIDSGAYNAIAGTTVDNLSLTSGQIVYATYKATGAAFASNTWTTTIQAAPEPPSVTFSFDGANPNKLMSSTTAMEYSLDGGTNWTVVGSADVDISGLLGSISASNDIKIRVKQTGNTPAGTTQVISILAGLAVTTYSIDYTGEQSSQNIATTDEYSLDNFATAGTSGSGAKLALTPETNVYFRVKKTGQTLAGSTQTLVVAGRMVAPAGVAIANGTTAGTFKLTGVDNTMEYKIDSGAYNAIAGTTVDNLSLTSGQIIYVKIQSNWGCICI